MSANRTPMLIEITCRLCGRPYTSTREDLACGPEVYHRCPECRPGPEADPCRLGKQAKPPGAHPMLTDGPAPTRPVVPEQSPALHVSKTR